MAPPTSGCLVLMCGHPASGKSTAAADLARRIEAKGGRVVLIDEPGLHLHRNASYADARAEKNTRGLLKSTAERALYRDGPVVILDAGNAIKGFRYELWCLARQAATRFCVVHCDTPPDEARRRNESRRALGDESAEWGGYDGATFDDLVYRFETPDGKNRWDAPLFVLRPPLELPPVGVAEMGAENGAVGDAGADVTANVAPTTSYVDTTREETLDVAVRMIVGESEAAGGSAAANGRDRALTQSSATQPSTLLSDTNLRAEMDAGAQDIIDAVMRAGADGAMGGAYEFGEGLPALRCRRQPSLQDLRRLKRSFLKIVANCLARTNTTRHAVKKLFIEYVQRNTELG
jgi:protein KTI12